MDHSCALALPAPERRDQLDRYVSEGAVAVVGLPSMPIGSCNPSSQNKPYTMKDAILINAHCWTIVERHAGCF